MKQERRLSSLISVASNLDSIIIMNVSIFVSLMKPRGSEYLAASCLVVGIPTHSVGSSVRPSSGLSDKFNRTESGNRPFVIGSCLWWGRSNDH